MWAPIGRCLYFNMEIKVMNIRTYMVSLLVLGALTAPVSRAQDFESMVIFGDSLSDPGNYYHLFGEQSLQPFEPGNVPSAPYPMGGHHFTNGETWIERLSRSLGMATSGSTPVCRAWLKSLTTSSILSAIASWLEGTAIALSG